MVFHLKVESARKATRDEATVRARSLHLRLEPTNGFHSFSALLVLHMRRVTVRMLKVVRKAKQNSQGEALRNTHEHDLTKRSPAPATDSVKRHEAIQKNVRHSQHCGNGRAAFDKVVVHANTNTLGSTLLQGQDLGVEHGRHPISSKDRNVEESYMRTRKR